MPVGSSRVGTGRKGHLRGLGHGCFRGAGSILQAVGNHRRALSKRGAWAALQESSVGGGGGQSAVGNGTEEASHSGVGESEAWPRGWKKGQERVKCLVRKRESGAADTTWASLGDQ